MVFADHQLQWYSQLSPSFSRGPLLGEKEKYSGFEAGALKPGLIPVLGRVSATLWPNQRLELEHTAPRTLLWLLDIVGERVFR